MRRRLTRTSTCTPRSPTTRSRTRGGERARRAGARRCARSASSTTCARDTTWVPEFAAAVAACRDQPGPRVLAGVEAKILDTAGRLDLPPDLDGIDLVLIADHQFPADDGPVAPGPGAGGDRQRRADRRRGDRAALRGERRTRCRRPDRGRVLAHLFSLLPKIGLDEAMVPAPLLGRLAERVAGRGGHGRGQREVGMPVAPHRRRHAAGRRAAWWRAATATTAATWASTARSG